MQKDLLFQELSCLDPAGCQVSEEKVARAKVDSSNSKGWPVFMKSRGFQRDDSFGPCNCKGRGFECFTKLEKQYKYENTSKGIL